jgi:hypothetical protein
MAFKKLDIALERQASSQTVFGMGCAGAVCTMTAVEIASMVTVRTVLKEVMVR